MPAIPPAAPTSSSTSTFRSTRFRSNTSRRDRTASHWAERCSPTSGARVDDMTPNPSTAEQRLREGDPLGALALLQEQVRFAPTDARLRLFLFQLLCVLGQW